MIDIYYIEMKNKDWANVNCYQAMIGFENLGYEVRGFEKHSVRDIISRNRNVLIHGNVGTVRSAFRWIEVEQPKILELPDRLQSIYSRNRYFTSLDSVREAYQGIDNKESDEPVFIKPAITHKLFDGHVVTCYRDLIYTAEFDGDTQVEWQDVVEFTSEWRVFVLEGKILNISHYKGDPCKFPNMFVIEGLIKNWKEAPVAYAADFGLAPNNTILVEVNDAFALGCYGLQSVDYARMIEARWKEITGIS